MKAAISQADCHTSPPPGRIRKSKYMDYWKTAEESKADVDDPRNLKQKRVFGTQRNTNVLAKPKTEKKSTLKSQVETGSKQPKSKKLVSAKAANLKDEAAEAELNDNAQGLKAEASEKDDGLEPEPKENASGSKAAVTEKDEVAEAGDEDKDEGLNNSEEKPTEETEVKPKKKKSVGFQEKVDEEMPAPRTPVQLSSSLRKPRRSGTPYHTAQNCRRCKVDKLESSSYWIEQIKLAESVGKHFASVMFFHLAQDCNAEPARSIKIELKRYLSRHGDLVKQKEWIEASRKYGLPVPKDEDTTIGEREDSKDQSNTENDSNVITCCVNQKRSNTA